MECLDCGLIEKYPRQRKCWRMFQLCGSCAFVKHPEIYRTMFDTEIQREKQK